MEDDGEAVPTYESAAYALLEHAIRDELHIASICDRVRSATGEVIRFPDDVLDQLAWAVATRLDYAFSIRWQPDWVRAGEPHVWSEEGSSFARCNVCLAESGAMESDAAVRTWHHQHQVADHSG